MRNPRTSVAIVGIAIASLVGWLGCACRYPDWRYEPGTQLVHSFDYTSDTLITAQNRAPRPLLKAISSLLISQEEGVSIWEDTLRGGRLSN